MTFEQFDKFCSENEINYYLKKDCGIKLTVVAEYIEITFRAPDNPNRLFDKAYEVLKK